MSLKNIIKNATPFIVGVGFLVGAGSNVYGIEGKLPGIQGYSIFEGYVFKDEDISLVKKLATVLAGESKSEYNPRKHKPYVEEVIRRLNPKESRITTEDLLRTEIEIYKDLSERIKSNKKKLT